MPSVQNNLQGIYTVEKSVGYYQLTIASTRTAMAIY